LHEADRGATSRPLFDHLADSVGPQIVGIYFQALGH
jgi:hypothetical protein